MNPIVTSMMQFRFDAADSVVVILPGTPLGFVHRSTADGRRLYQRLPPPPRQFVLPAASAWPEHRHTRGLLDDC